MRTNEIRGVVASIITGQGPPLQQTKNRTERRELLWRRAVDVLLFLPAAPVHKPPFDMMERPLDSLFRETKQRATIKGRAFNDNPTFQLCGWQNGHDRYNLFCPLLEIYLRQKAEHGTQRHNSHRLVSPNFASLRRQHEHCFTSSICC